MLWIAAAARPLPSDESVAEATLDTSSPWSTLRLGALAVALAAPLVALAGYPFAYVMCVALFASGLPGAQASVPAGLVAAACLAAALAVVRRARPLVVLGAVVALALGAVLTRAHAGTATPGTAPGLAGS